MLTEIAHPPKIMTNVPLMIQPEQFKKDLDSYLKTRSPATFPSDLRSKLQVWLLLTLPEKSAHLLEIINGSLWHMTFQNMLDTTL